MRGGDTLARGTITLASCRSVASRNTGRRHRSRGGAPLARRECRAVQRSPSLPVARDLKFLRDLVGDARFESATAPRFVLDLRRAGPDAADSGWLFESSPFRAIFNAFDPARAEDFWRQAALARQYDAVVHFDSTGPTVPLPWLPPAKF